MYLFMNLIVLPLSLVPHSLNVTTASRINGVLAVVLLIGLTISLLVRSKRGRSDVHLGGVVSFRGAEL